MCKIKSHLVKAKWLFYALVKEKIG